ncbi:hypothetical protein ACUDCK_29765 (plasmid) [Achromobacter sp. CF-sbj1-Ac2-l]|jgi:hypothetical protein|uniref:hypothetical protein n=1 Tax=Achromobacter TaxID=222 RepID=UPI0006C4339C|nr:hypothetical protein [Achromobacter xylosoxidans]CUJ64201.1 Uncharacterised protein [Achromobacter xylosoxidans]
MSMAAQYAGLKRRIEQYESDHPDLVVLAVQANRLAVSSVTAGRPSPDAPLEKVIYKKKFDLICLVLASGYGWAQRNVIWSDNLHDVKVDPRRPRTYGQPARVIFEEVDH